MAQQLPQLNYLAPKYFQQEIYRRVGTGVTGNLNLLKAWSKIPKIIGFYDYISKIQQKDDYSKRVKRNSGVGRKNDHDPLNVDWSDRERYVRWFREHVNLRDKQCVSSFMPVLQGLLIINRWRIFCNLLDKLKDW